MDARCRVVAMPVAFCFTAFGIFLGGCRLKLDKTAHGLINLSFVCGTQLAITFRCCKTINTYPGSPSSLRPHL